MRVDPATCEYAATLRRIAKTVGLREGFTFDAVEEKIESLLRALQASADGLVEAQAELALMTDSNRLNAEALMEEEDRVDELKARLASAERVEQSLRAMLAAAAGRRDEVEARLAEAEKDCEANDNVRKEYLAAARKAVTRAEAAEADRDRLRAFVAKARPLLGMNVPGSLGAEATELLGQQPTSIGAVMRGE